MRVDIIFSFSKVYHIEKADIVLGQKFSLQLESTEPVRWFSDNDPVLSLTGTGNTANVEATSLGTSTILILNESFGVVKMLTINVVDAIDNRVTDLGLSADPPVDKP